MRGRGTGVTAADWNYQQAQSLKEELERRKQQLEAANKNSASLSEIAVRCEADNKSLRQRIAELERCLVGPDIAECILQNREDERRKAHEEGHKLISKLEQQLKAEQAKVATAISIGEDMICLLREEKRLGTAKLFELAIATLQAPETKPL